MCMWHVYGNLFFYRLSILLFHDVTYQNYSLYYTEFNFIIHSAKTICKSNCRTPPASTWSFESSINYYREVVRLNSIGQIILLLSLYNILRILSMSFDHGDVQLSMELS